MGKRRSVQPHVVEMLEGRRLLSGGANFLVSHVPVMHFRHLGHARGTGHGTRHLAHQQLATGTAAVTSTPLAPTTADPGVTPTQPSVPTVNYLSTRGTQTLASLTQTQAAGAATGTSDVAVTNTTAPVSGPTTLPSSMLQTNPVVAGTMPPMPTSVPTGVIPIDPGQMPSFLGNITLSKADVTQLKTTIDTFAGAYTSGADAAKDKAALGALQQGIQDLSSQIWSENHIVSQGSVATLQQAVDNFAASYTGGKNVAQDTAAWATLQAGLSDFWNAASGTGGTMNPTPFPAGLTAMPFGSPPIMAGPLFGATSGTLDLGQTPLSKDNVSKLRQAVDTFAGAYTSGADAAKDKAAASSLESSLQELASSIWAAPTPLPPIAAMTLVVAQPATTVAPAQGSSASSTAATPANAGSGTA